ncbi:MAG: shikimate kinase [Flavobacteriaceae bacterium]
MKYQKIVLLGYMGSGKSLIGKLLSKSLGIPFRDLDTLIELETNSSIAHYFSSKGEIAFRALEHQVFEKTIKNQASMILALGGGTPCYYDHMQTLTKDNNIFSVYLNVSLPTLATRLFEEKEQRPLIAQIATKDQLIEFVGKHLFERNQFYKQADFEIQLEHQTPEEILSVIAQQLA